MTYNQDTISALTAESLALLRELIRIPSVSRDEARAADCMEAFVRQCGLDCRRTGCNVAAVCRDYTPQRPTLLLNAHLDTVRPTAAWTRDPHSPDIIDGRLYGLGSNDCGGGLVSLLAAFRALEGGSGLYNIIYLASAEEEVSGANGIAAALPQLPPISCAIVGEPTGMRPATAEKGLMVVDATAHGRAGHAARNEGDNAVYHAVDDIQKLRRLKFDRVSPLLGEVHLNATVISGGTAHNVVPAECKFTIDVRTNELYTNREVFAILQSELGSELKERSFRLSSSGLDPGHPLVRACQSMGMEPFGSPTLSDQALMPFPSIKLGPGQSARSHTADEYILTEEIAGAVPVYVELVRRLSQYAPANS